MPATHYTDDMVLNWLRGNATTPPVAIYLAALTAAASLKIPTITEVPNSNGYARVAFTLGIPSSGVSINAADVFFPVASGSWGTISHLAICNSGAYGGGNVLMIIPLTTPTAITVGQQLSFNTSTYKIEVTMD